MSDPIPLSGLFCTDEDIYVRDPGDYWDLCPDSQGMARGKDGVILGSSPWTLTSASAAFIGSVTPGMVVLLKSEVTPDPFGPDGDTLAVDSVAPHALTLRRVGQAATGVGMPPVLANLTGVEFSVLTFTPQINNATFDMMRRFAIDDNIPWDSSDYIYDLRELRKATVLTVLYDQYTNESRGKDGDWSAKIARVAADLEATLDKIALRWGVRGFGEPPRSQFRMRLTR